MATRPFGYNPFLGTAADPNDMAAAMSRQASDRMLHPDYSAGLTVQDHVAIARAPKRRGTTVTVESYPLGFTGGAADHMYAQFDDGRDSYIYRGGPGPNGRLDAGVVPAPLSRDFGKGSRVQFQTFLPDVSAAQAVAPARADAARIAASADPYLGITSNSNSVIGDFTARTYGHRVGRDRRYAGHGWTPGYDDDLPTEPPTDPIPPGMYRPTNPIW